MKGAVRKPGYQSPSILSPSSSPPSDSSKEQERYLPIANVSRIMKRSLPSNAKISKEAKETVQECVSEFISFITGEASDKCQREKRKTINGDDLLWAMTTLGFDPYVAPLKTFLNRYRESEGEKNAVARLQETADIVPPSLSEEGTAVGFDPGFYSPAQGFGGGGNGLFGKMDSGRGPPLQGQVYGFRW